MMTSADAELLAAARRANREEELGPPQGVFSGQDAAAAIAFALAIPDPYECQDFLRGWDVGDTREWPEFKPAILNLPPGAVDRP